MTRDKTNSYRIFDFLVKYIDDNGYPPTHREIGEAVFLSSSTIPRHLDLLAKRGLIRYDAGKFRGLAVLKRNYAKD